MAAGVAGPAGAVTTADIKEAAVGEERWTTRLRPCFHHWARYSCHRVHVNHGRHTTQRNRDETAQLAKVCGAHGRLGARGFKAKHSSERAESM